MNYQQATTQNNVFVNKLLFFAIVFLSTHTAMMSQDCNRTTFRSLDGKCNNLVTTNTQHFGAAKRPFLRAIPAKYSPEDSLGGLLFPNRPNPRAISNAIFDQIESVGNPSNLSSLVFTWGQFLDHDITFTKGARTEPAPINLPPDEPSFTTEIMFSRSGVVEGTGITNPRNQENEITAWVDASQVYGSDTVRANWLRTFRGGKLKVSQGNLLPYNTINNEKTGTIDPNTPHMESIDQGRTPHFIAGDTRANEQPGLTALHTLFVREHNRLCDELSATGLQDDEQIYQIARKQIGALMQIITYSHFLPALGIELQNYTGYDNQVNPDIMNIFATAAFRIGHTMVTSNLLVLANDCEEIRRPLSLEEAFFNNRLIDQFGIDPFLHGLASQQQEAIDTKVEDGLRDFLFAMPQNRGAFGLDLVALNIQRGRDHGLPDYKTVREFFTGESITGFDQINDEGVIANDLAAIYNNNLEEIDPWVGLLSEKKLSGELISPTMQAILRVQFERLRDGDFYYYENDPFFDAQALIELKNTTFRDIITRNTAINDLATDVFLAETCNQEEVACEAIEINTLPNQIEITGLDAPFCAIKVFDKNEGWAVVADCNGPECSPTQIFEVPEGDYLVEMTFYDDVWRNFICKKEVELSVEGTSGGTTFDCADVKHQIDGNTITINGLTAPFTTVKLFDVNAGWQVVADCIGDNCGESTPFNLPNGDYYLQLSAYQGTWTDLICAQDFAFTIQDASSANCDDIRINTNDDSLQISGLNAPFNVVKVFDIDQGWKVVADCAEDDCSDSKIFSLPAGNYYTEVTMYEGNWSNQICSQLIPINWENGADSRNSNPVQVSIFPNPAQEIIYLEVPTLLNKHISLQLTNQFGQVLKHLDFPVLKQEILELTLEDIPNGWYYLTTTAENSIPATQKIIVNRLY